MTNEQQQIIQRARERMSTTRHMLDDVMYGIQWRDKLSESEFKKVRECYDKLCEAIDKLP